MTMRHGKLSWLQSFLHFIGREKNVITRWHGRNMRVWGYSFVNMLVGLDFSIEIDLEMSNIMNSVI